MSARIRSPQSGGIVVAGAQACAGGHGARTPVQITSEVGPNRLCRPKITTWNVPTVPIEWPARRPCQAVSQAADAPCA
jgi:hypothetical protein